MTADIISTCTILFGCGIALIYAGCVVQKQDEEIASLKANQKPLE